MSTIRRLTLNDRIGKGRCNHVAHQEPGESTEEFVERVQYAQELTRRTEGGIVMSTVRRLALNDRGELTYCTAPPDRIGIGRCNHVAHQEPGESPQEFVERVQHAPELQKDLLQDLQSFMQGLSINLGQIRTGADNLMFDQNGRPTPLAIATALKQVSIVFKGAMLRQDEGRDKYSVLSKPKEVLDPQGLQEFMRKYKPLEKELADRMKEFRQQHPEMFQSVPAVPNTAPYLSVSLNQQFQEQPIDLDVAHYLFRESERLHKQYVNQNEQLIKIAERKVVLPQYKDQYEEYRRRVMQEIGLPTTQEIQQEARKHVPFVTVQSRNLRRARPDDHVQDDPNKLSEARQHLHQYLGSLFECFVKG